MSCWCVVVAAGRSERFGGPLPKVLVEHRGRTLLARALATIDACPAVDRVVLVASEEVERAWSPGGAGGLKVSRVVRGGASRQESVARGLEAVDADADVILVHDAARAFASRELFERVAEAARRSGCALPLLAVTDTIKRVTAEGLRTVPRDELRMAQTPQGFRADVLRAAHAGAAPGEGSATDDVALVEQALAAGRLAGVSIEAVAGEETNVKVTRPSDLPRASALRVGMGHDVHPLAAGRRFVLAGIDVQAGVPQGERFGPVGHSDGDAVVHAACDALLSACAQPDIGQLFPDTSPEHEGRSSMEFLELVARRCRDEGWRPVNLSIVVQLERPRLAPHAEGIRAAIAAALGIGPDCVGFSAKRGEGLGDVGQGRAVACDCVALVERA